MGRFPTRNKLIAFSLILGILVLSFSALSLWSKMVEAQKKVHDLQSQVANYENMTDVLQTQASSLEAQIYRLQNPIDDVAFTAISVGPWYLGAYAPSPYYKDISVTFQNVGTRSIGGVTLDFKVEGNTTNIDRSRIFVRSGLLGVIHVQESENFNASLLTWGMGETQFLSQYNLTITLLLDQLVLDRQTVRIGP